MRIHLKPAPIEVRTDAEGRPAALTLGGHPHRVQTVEDVREPRLEWWSPAGEVHRVYYLVTTDRGLICEVYHDVRGGGWFLARTMD